MDSVKRRLLALCESARTNRLLDLDAEECAIIRLVTAHNAARLRAEAKAEDEKANVMYRSRTGGADLHANYAHRLRAAADKLEALP
jgi:hypothetical protein